MIPDILIARKGDTYCLLHGYLRLFSALNASKETFVFASGKGEVKVIKTNIGLFVEDEGIQLPLMRGDGEDISAARATEDDLYEMLEIV